MAPGWVSRYVGISFRDRGRSPAEGFDCYGLVWWVLRTHYGKTLPSYQDDYENTKDSDAIGRLIDLSKPVVEARRIDLPEPGAVAIIERAGLPIHIGIVVDDRYILHADPREGVVLDRITGYRLRGRIEGFYRVG